MSDTVIRVENLGKKYILGHQQEKQNYTALRDVIANSVKGLTQRLCSGPSRLQESGSEEFWALDDVSFDIKQGDRVGIIGRNGAGKSTLLKILSRITEPTTGKISINGRVASLLEVGTGFHPELTGRENIFLNGAILGMSQVEIKRKFDEIVDFAEVEKFLDTPVKRYSSGMYVRLAFAVAAHLEPEILIVDEVLAVGDAQFQKKCLGKMEDVAGQGRTVLFVSHNMAAVQKLCSKGIFLKSGQLILEDSAESCVAEYLNSGDYLSHTNSFYSVNEGLTQKTKKGIKITAINLDSSSSDRERKIIQTNDPLLIRIAYAAKPELFNETIAFVVRIKSTFGQEIIRLSTTPISGYEINGLGDRGQVELKIENLPLTAGRYFIDLEVARPNIEYLVQIQELVMFQVEPRDVYGSGMALDQSRGILVVPHQWSHTVNHSLAEVTEHAIAQ